MLDRRLSAQRFDELEDGALLFRPCERLIALEERWDFRAEFDYATRFARGMRVLRPTERTRQRRSKHHSQRNDVVIRHPSAQLEQRLTNRGLGVRRFEHRLGFSLERADVARTDADPHFLTAP